MAATLDGAGEGIQEATAERYGRLRLSNVADVVGGKLDPAAYLRKGRHAEWTEAMRGAPLSPGPSSEIRTVIILQCFMLMNIYRHCK